MFGDEARNQRSSQMCWMLPGAQRTGSFSTPNCENHFFVHADIVMLEQKKEKVS